MFILGKETSLTELQETLVMVQPACEMCGKELGRLERQYIAAIDIRPTTGAAEADEEAGDRDHLLEIHEMLEAVESHEDDEANAFEPQEFLLCHDCCCRFQNEPLPRETVLQVGFSEN